MKKSNNWLVGVWLVFISIIGYIIGWFGFVDKNKNKEG